MCIFYEQNNAHIRMAIAVYLLRMWYDVYVGTWLCNSIDIAFAFDTLYITTTTRYHGTMNII